MASRDAAVEYEQMAGWLRHFRHLSLRLLRLPSYEFRVYGPDYLARSLPRLEASYKGSRIRIRGRPEAIQSSRYELSCTDPLFDQFEPVLVEI
jgi:hypothetical protein